MEVKGVDLAVSTYSACREMSRGKPMSEVTATRSVEERLLGAATYGVGVNGSEGGGGKKAVG